MTYERPTHEQLLAMTPEQLGASFVAMIKAGGRTQADRELVRDSLLDGVIQHPVTAKVIREADYVVQPRSL